MPESKKEASYHPIISKMHGPWTHRDSGCAPARSFDESLGNGLTSRIGFRGQPGLPVPRRQHRHGDSTADRASTDSGFQIRSQFFDVNGDFYTLRLSSTDGFSGGSSNMRFANAAHFQALDAEIW